MSSGFRSAAILREYFGEILSHRPERSGLPSGARGAGAARFGLPSGVRGIPGVGGFNHYAGAPRAAAVPGIPSAALKPSAKTPIEEAFMFRPHFAARIDTT